MSTIIAKVNQQVITDLPKDLYIDPDALQVFLEMFEGPLELLLYLIRRQNLDILAIPITKITRQYIDYINAMQILNIDLAAEYLLMAAMLLEIKSRMLLPRPVIEDSGNSEEVDPRQELIQKLIEYEKIKEAAQKLSELPQANRDYLWLDVLMDNSMQVLPEVSLKDLQQAWHTILIKSITANKEHHIKRRELSVREHMTNIVRFLKDKQSASFYSLFNPSLGVPHVVVNFIAILELTKEGLTFLTTDNSEIIVNLSKK